MGTIASNAFGSMNGSLKFTEVDKISKILHLDNKIMRCLDKKSATLAHVPANASLRLAEFIADRGANPKQGSPQPGKAPVCIGKSTAEKKR
jgi:hypothetical protein